MRKLKAEEKNPFIVTRRNIRKLHVIINLLRVMKPGSGINGFGVLGILLMPSLLSLSPCDSMGLWLLITLRTLLNDCMRMDFQGTAIQDQNTPSHSMERNVTDHPKRDYLF